MPPTLLHAAERLVDDDVLRAALGKTPQGDYIDYFAQVLELIDRFGISKTGRSHPLDGEDLVFAGRDSGEMEFSVVARWGAVIEASQVVIRADWRNHDPGALGL